jgi:hypothetical protein
MALILTRLYPDDPEQLETALRLADFSLKGQHPGGMFYDQYDLRRNCWVGLKTQPIPDKTQTVPELRIDEAAEVCIRLLDLAQRLQVLDQPYFAYTHGAARFVDLLFDDRGRATSYAAIIRPTPHQPVEDGIGFSALVPSLRWLRRQTAKDRYQKALRALRDYYFTNPPDPLASLENVHLSLLLAQGAVLLAQEGFKIKELPAYLDQLLPWIYVNHNGDPQIDLAGGALSSWKNTQLHSRSFELAHTLLQFKALLSRTGVWLDKAVAQLLHFAGKQPLGTAFYDLSPESNQGPHPIDARVLVRETLYLFRLFDESLL